MAKSNTSSPIDDLTYDVITVLQSKAKALLAYDKYLKDANEEQDEDLKDLFSEMRKQDEHHLNILKEALARRLDDELGYDYESDDEEEEEDEIEDGGDYRLDGDEAPPSDRSEAPASSRAR